MTKMRIHDKYSRQQWLPELKRTTNGRLDKRHQTSGLTKYQNHLLSMAWLTISVSTMLAKSKAINNNDGNLEESHLWHNIYVVAQSYVSVSDRFHLFEIRFSIIFLKCLNLWTLLPVVRNHTLKSLNYGIWVSKNLDTKYKSFHKEYDSCMELF